MFQRFMLPPSAGLKCMFMKLYALHCCLPIEVLDVWFEVSIAMQIEVGGFWIVAPCRLAVVNKHFGGCAASIFRVEFRSQEIYPLYCCLPSEVANA